LWKKVKNRVRCPRGKKREKGEVNRQKRSSANLLSTPKKQTRGKRVTGYLEDSERGNKKVSDLAREGGKRKEQPDLSLPNG